MKLKTNLATVMKCDSKPADFGGKGSEMTGRLVRICHATLCIEIKKFFL
jgi:hypothetical protein